MSTVRYAGASLVPALLALLAPGAAAQSDWDLHALRLVNRARQDPAAEAALIGSAVTDASAPVPPLAYGPAIGAAEAAHNGWMHDNLDAIASGQAPDSFTHYETLDGTEVHHAYLVLDFPGTGQALLASNAVPLELVP